MYFATHNRGFVILPYKVLPISASFLMEPNQFSCVPRAYTGSSASAGLCKLRDFVMNYVKQKLAVLAVGALCAAGSLGTASAATVSTPTAQSVAPIGDAGKGTIELVKEYPRGGGGGRPSGKQSGGGGSYYPKPGGGKPSGGYPGGGYPGKHNGKHFRGHRGGGFYFYGSPFYYDDG